MFLFLLVCFVLCDNKVFWVSGEQQEVFFAAYGWYNCNQPMLALLKEALSASEERLLVSDHLTVLFKSGTSTPQGITTVSFFFWFGLFTARHNRN